MGVSEWEFNEEQISEAGRKIKDVTHLPSEVAAPAKSAVELALQCRGSDEGRGRVRSRRRCMRRGWGLVRRAICLRAPYAMSGTNTPYGAAACTEQRAAGRYHEVPDRPRRPRCGPYFPIPPRQLQYAGNVFFCDMSSAHSLNQDVFACV
eukprot:1392254-Rhodomonas_salina.2